MISSRDCMHSHQWHAPFLRTRALVVLMMAVLTDVRGTSLWL